MFHMVIWNKVDPPIFGFIYIYNEISDSLWNHAFCASILGKPHISPWERTVDPPPGAPQELWAAAAPAPAALDAWGDRDTSAWAAAPLGRLVDQWWPADFTQGTWRLNWEKWELIADL